MKIPKTFVSDKNLDKNIEKLLSENPMLKSYNETTVSALLRSCEKFLGRQKITSNLLEIYNIGEELAKKINFTKNDLKELIQRTTIYHSRENYNQEEYIGFYLSALINKIITEEEPIILQPDIKLFGIGAYLKAGKIIIEGDLGYFLCHCMEDGIIIAKGNVEDNAGNGMKGGKLIVKGDLGDDVGSFMEGGDIIVYGQMGRIAETCKGRIFQWGKQVWPK